MYIINLHMRILVSYEERRKKRDRHVQYNYRCKLIIKDRDFAFTQ